MKTLDEHILLSHVLSCDRAYLYAHPEIALTPEQEAQYQQLLARRKQGEPIAYIVGQKEFWSLPLKVSSDTLVPRPETEILVEKALACFPDHTPKKVLDLGTGSGAIALALAQERPEWKIFASDISSQALSIAKENAGSHAIEFFQGSWFEPIPNQLFDMIISNPPYLTESEYQAAPKDLSYEPKSALVSGEDGLEAIRHIIHKAKKYLYASGYLLLEHGSTQGLDVRNILIQHGYKDVETFKDLAGLERVTLAKH